MADFTKDEIASLKQKIDRAWKRLVPLGVTLRSGLDGEAMIEATACWNHEMLHRSFYDRFGRDFYDNKDWKPMEAYNNMCESWKYMDWKNSNQKYNWRTESYDPI